MLALEPLESRRFESRNRSYHRLLLSRRGIHCLALPHHRIISPPSMKPRGRLKLIRALLVMATVVCSGLVVLLVWLITVAWASPSPDSTSPETLLTLPTSDARFVLTIRRTPVAAHGRVKLVATIEDTQGSLPGPPLVLSGKSVDDLPALSWSNHSILVMPRPNGPPTPIGRVVSNAAGATSPSFRQVWE